MIVEERIEALIQLGHILSQKDEYRDAVIHRTYMNNRWFTKKNQQLAIDAIAAQFLEEKKLRQWLNTYNILDNNAPAQVGLVLAGNIPLVGFHDVMCTFISGHISQIKLSDKDKYLLSYIFRALKQIDPRTEKYFRVVEKLQAFDAVIATGSNNSARYFEAYFGKVPHIIRRNRNAVAILDGKESKEDLSRLGKDVFQYYGLGCRNVAKIYVPRGYQFEPLLEALHEYNDIILNDKYKNNFDYNYAIYVLNKAKYMANGCIILTESEAITSHIAGLNYSFYDQETELEAELIARQDEIQCVVTRSNLSQIPTFDFGQAQEPGLADYADGVDTIDFLLRL